MEKEKEALRAWIGSGAVNVFGMPFCNKDEIARRLADDFGGVMVSSGDIIRNAEQNILHHSLTASGRYFPSGYFYQLVLPYLRDKSFAGRPLFLASVGRSEGEESLVMKILHDAGHDYKAVVILNAPEAVVLQRREDAQKSGAPMHPEDAEILKFQVKLREYRSKTTPVINRYRAMSLGVDVNAVQDVDAMYAECIDRLYYFMTHK